MACNNNCAVQTLSLTEPSDVTMEGGAGCFATFTDSATGLFAGQVSNNSPTIQLPTGDYSIDICCDNCKNTPDNVIFSSVPTPGIITKYLVSVTDNGDGTYTIIDSDDTETIIDVNQVPSGTTNPSPGTEGSLFYNTTDSTMYYNLNGTWVAAGGITGTYVVSVVDNGNNTYTVTDSNSDTVLIDVNQVPSGTTNPAPGTPESLFYNTTDSTMYYNLNGTWVAAGGITGTYVVSVVDNGNNTYTVTDSNSDTVLIDVNQVPSGTTNPAPGTPESLFYNTTDSTMYYNLNGTWVAAGGSSTGATADILGSIFIWSQDAVPDWLVEANGQLVSRATYPDLWTLVAAEAIDETTWATTTTDSLGNVVQPNKGKFSTGDGTTTFRVPDLQGEFIRGQKSGIQEVGIAQGDAIRNLTGILGIDVVVNHDQHVSGVFEALGGLSTTIPPKGGVGGAEAVGTWGYGINASRTVPTANENRPVNVAYKLCVVAKRPPGILTSGTQVSSVNSMNGDVVLYGDSIARTTDNPQTLESAITHVETDKVSWSSHTFNDLLDVETAADGEKGIVYRDGDNTYKLGGIVTEGVAVASTLQLSKSTEQIIPNLGIGSLDELITFDLSAPTGTDFSTNTGSDIVFNVTPTNYRGHLRVPVSVVDKPNNFPITMQLVLYKNGVATANVSTPQIYTGNDTFTLQLDSANDETIVAGDYIEFRLQSSTTSANTEVTITTDAYARVENRTETEASLFIERRFLQRAKIQLQDIVGGIVPSTPTPITFDSAPLILQGTAFTFDGVDTITINRKCRADILIACQFEKSAGGSTGVYQIQVFKNGALAKNFYRAKEVLNGLSAITIEFKGIGVDLEAGDTLQIREVEETGGSISRLDNVKHSACLFTVNEV